MTSRLLADHRHTTCPECGGSKNRQSDRCAGCYKAARRNRGNRVQQMPMPIPASAPMAPWQQPPPVEPRPGPPLVRWVLDEWEIWVEA